MFSYLDNQAYIHTVYLMRDVWSTLKLLSACGSGADGGVESTVKNHKEKQCNRRRLAAKMRTKLN